MTDLVMRAGTETAAIVPEVWSAKFYDVLEAKLPFVDSVSRDYEGEIKALGDTVRISTIPEFGAAGSLAEDEVASADAVTITSQSLVINTRLYKDFIFTDLAKMQSLEFMDKVRDKAVYSLKKQLEALLVAATVPSAATPDHQISFDSGTTLALADLLEAKELLDGQDVEEEGRKLVCGVAQLNDLFTISGFTSKDFIGGSNPLVSGKISELAVGFEVKSSSELGNVAYCFHPSYMTMAMQSGVNINVYDLGSQGKRAYRVNCDMLLGIKQLDNKRVVGLS